MKKNLPILRKPFDHLLGCLISISDKDFVLNPSIGEGRAQRFGLEEGLEAWVLDCSLKRGIEIEKYLIKTNHETCFTVTYFLQVYDTKLSIGRDNCQIEIHQDRLLLSQLQDESVWLAPMSRLRCLCISFSKSWLSNIAKDNPKLHKIYESICATENILISDAMTSAEKEQICELFNLSKQKQFGTFYVRTAVLKIMIDFLRNLGAERFTKINTTIRGTIDEIKNYLRKHITGGIPDLKALATEFCLSESTLKRHFKKHTGLTMSAFFIQSKMEYAQQLISKQGTTVAETAGLVGYRSVHKFVRMYKKHSQHSMAVNL
jgi:AraC-like DNA-binding protein